MRVQRRLRRWRAFGLLLTLVVAALAALVAAWRFAPDRVPPPLQPLALMRHFGVTPPTSPQLPRRPLPPGSQYDEWRSARPRIAVAEHRLAKILRLWRSRNITIAALSGRARAFPKRKMRARRRAKWGVEKT
jgi:hypothetical protein